VRWVPGIDRVRKTELSRIETASRVVTRRMNAPMHLVAQSIGELQQDGDRHDGLGVRGGRRDRIESRSESGEIWPRWPGEDFADEDLTDLRKLKHADRRPCGNLFVRGSLLVGRESSGLCAPFDIDAIGNPYCVARPPSHIQTAPRCPADGIVFFQKGEALNDFDARVCMDKWGHSVGITFTKGDVT